MNLIHRNLLGLSFINFELASDGMDVLKAWMKKAKTELEQSTEGR